MFLSAFCCVNATQYICSQSVLNVHKEPRELSEVVSQFIWAEPVNLIEVTGDDWVKVTTQDYQEGWVPFSRLTALEDDQSYPLIGKIAMVTSRLAHVYLVPDIKMYPPLFSLPYGAKLELVKTDVQNDRLVALRLVNGEVVYMQRSDLVTNPKVSSVKEMIEIAKSFIGVPFVWGGASSYGFDNSGFVAMLYRNMGIQLPHELGEQMTMAEINEIRVSELQPGDLMYFSQSNTQKIDHVGIYLGNSEFIHTSALNTPPGVQVASLRTPVWQTALKKCGHIARDA